MTGVGQSQLKASFLAQEPVLCCTWNEDGSKVFTGACDKKSILWDLGAEAPTQVATHDMPINFVHWHAERQLLVTGSWDRTLRYWDIRQSKPTVTIRLPEQLCAADARGHITVVATTGRKIIVYDMNNPLRPFRAMDSRFKLPTQCVRVFPDQKGFAMGSIGGRVVIQYLDNRDPG